MKLGLNSLFLPNLEFEEGLRYAQDLGVEVIEMACIGGPSSRYCDPDKLLAHQGELDRWLDALERHGLKVSGFCAHGEPLSPDKEVSDAYSRRFRQICRLAEAATVDRLTTNSGIPEGAPGDTAPCWVVDSFKPHNRSILRWQWEERVIPFWREHARIAQDHGCLLAIEPQIGEVIYTPQTLMKLRQAIGPVIGCNLDPSHLLAQQIDPNEAILFMADAIYHVHIKDTRIDPRKVRQQGWLDLSPHIEPEKRTWHFAVIGWGHGERFWREFITNLRFVGYEGALSVEMECAYLQVQDGVEKSIAFLKPLLLEDAPAPGERWWEHAGSPSLLEDGRKKEHLR